MRFKSWTTRLFLVAAASLVVVVASAALPSTEPVTSSPPSTAPALSRPTPTLEKVRLTIHPMPTSSPAMQYHLIPQIADEVPGNAYAEYLTAREYWPRANGRDKAAEALWLKVDSMTDAPPNTLSVAEARSVLDNFGTDWVDRAARCPTIDWGFPYRQIGHATLLPNLNDMRGVGEVVKLRIKTEIAAGDFPAAAYALQTGFGLTRQMNHQVVLVQGTMTATMISQEWVPALDDWIARDGSPNLYWSFCELPANSIDLPEISQNAQAGAGFTDPLLAKAIDGSMPADRWHDALVSAIRLTWNSSGMTHQEADAEEAVKVELKRVETMADPAARVWLRTRGLTEEQVTATPVDQAVGEFFVAQYHFQSDNQWKAWPLPFPAAGPFLQAADQYNAKIRLETGNPFVALGCPPLFKIRAYLGRPDQWIAMLRVIEALRDYAAAHGGNPPESLDQITALPVPVDPISGKLFDYRLSGRVATLTSFIPPGLSPTFGRQYELTFPIQK